MFQKRSNMKKLLLVMTGVAILGTSAIAQDKDHTKAVRHKVTKGAKAVAHNTAEAASKVKSRVVDNVYEDKVGPNGEKIYIDNDSKYYWIDERGHKRYVKESELKDKPED